MIENAYDDPLQGVFEDDNEGIFNYKRKEYTKEEFKSMAIGTSITGQNLIGPKETKTSWEVREIEEDNKRKQRQEEIIQEYASQHLPGAKLDNEKPKLDLVLGSFAKALVEIGKVGTMGANKYSENGWLSVENAETRYLSAALRHYYNYKDADESDIDPESNLPHLAHMAWNALAVLELYLRKQK